MRRMIGRFQVWLRRAPLRSGSGFMFQVSGFMFQVSGFMFLVSGVFAQSSSYDVQVGSYIKVYSNIAVEEMKQYHIPASITLAQGIIESGAGQSRLAKEANNHFGIKCHADWKGKTFHQDDDRSDECFRKYDRAEDSFRDHSYFLTLRDRYKGLFSLPLTDYRGWAEGLETAGYATSREYAEMLIRTIEQYQLFLYDGKVGIAEKTMMFDSTDFVRYAWVAGFVPAGKAADGRRKYINNELECVVANKTDKLSTLSVILDIPVKRLMKYNDLKVAGTLEPGQVVYLEPKRRKAAVKEHIAGKTESLYEISQRYGIKMKFLLKRSGMAEGINPYPGQVLKLR